MAMTPQERKAYQKEYYQKYTKKGLKKGRKKGSKKKTSSKSLLGQSTSGLSAEGKMQAALIREDFKKQMNDALSKAKTDEERNQIRLDYSRKALAAIEKLKSDPKNVKPSTAKSSSSKSKGSSKSGNSGKSESSKSNKTGTTVASKTLSAETKKALDNINKKISEILSNDTISKLSEQEKADLKIQLSGMIERIKRLRSK